MPCEGVLIETIGTHADGLIVWMGS
jgi:hypothetical protein